MWVLMGREAIQRSSLTASSSRHIVYLMPAQVFQVTAARSISGRRAVLTFGVRFRQGVAKMPETAALLRYPLKVISATTASLMLGQIMAKRVLYCSTRRI